jgi:hypothetical protein
LNAHEDTWLVASIDRAKNPNVLEGTLGCPVCSAEYRIRDGVVWFGDAPAAEDETPSPAEALRLAAALDLTDARMTAILHGSWGAHASILRGLSPAQMLLVNPPTGVTSGDGISIVRAPVAPVTAAWADAAALDGADAAIAESFAALRGGRAAARGPSRSSGWRAARTPTSGSRNSTRAPSPAPGRHLAPRSR